MFVFTFVFISKLVCLTELNTVIGKAKLTETRIRLTHTATHTDTFLTTRMIHVSKWVETTHTHCMTQI